jgi:hypothetical protein
MSNFLETLQQKPYATRVKILWGTTAVLALVILGIWVISIKTSIKNTPGNLLVPNLVNGKAQSDSQFISVEGAETTAAGTKIYFNFNNQTDDILNVSTIENIHLTANGETVKPTALNDRQGQPFAKKILSHTQVFGVLTFPQINSPTGTLTFEEMFLEKLPDSYLKQSIDLDLNKLKLDAKLRN